MAELELEHGYHNFLGGAFHFNQAFLLGLDKKGWHKMWGKKRREKLRGEKGKLPKGLLMTPC